MKANCCLVSLICVLVTLVTIEAKEKKIPLGSVVDQFTFTDIHYLPRTLKDLGEAKAYVIVFTTTACPLAQRYLPRLQELSSQYSSKGVQFLSLNVGAEDSIKEVAYQAIEQRIDFPFAKDFQGQCARAVGATRTPEVVVLDGARKLRYRGRIDNQYRLGGVRPTADRQDLKEAIDDVLASRKVRVSETAVDGCVITFPAAPPSDQSLTYAKDVAPILNKHCVQCHRPGTEAPFTLLSYEKVAGKAETIAEVVEEQRMPPWFAHPGFGKFVNDRSLTPEERSTLVQWARGGRSPGDLAQAPKPPQFP